MRRIPLLLLLSLYPWLGACATALNQGLQPGDEHGTVVHTIDEDTPPDVEPAHVYEIDGEPVLHQRRSYALSPGEHTLRVWPEGPAQRMVPDLEAIDRKQIQVDPLTIDVKPGYKYFVAARRTQTRPVVTVVTEDGERTTVGPWQVTITPVVVKEEPPVTLERAVKGMSGFVRHARKTPQGRADRRPVGEVALALAASGRGWLHRLDFEVRNAGEVAGVATPQDGLSRRCRYPDGDVGRPPTRRAQAAKHLGRPAGKLF